MIKLKKDHNNKKGKKINSQVERNALICWDFFDCV